MLQEISKIKKQIKLNFLKTRGGLWETWMSTNIVYINGKTIRNRYIEPEITIPDITIILCNPNNYDIEYFNDDLSKGDKILKLIVSEEIISLYKTKTV